MRVLCLARNIPTLLLICCLRREEFLKTCVKAGSFQDYVGAIPERCESDEGICRLLGEPPAHKRGVLEFARKHEHLLP